MPSQGADGLSVAIPTLNRGPYVADTAEALVDQAREDGISLDLLLLDQTRRHDSVSERRLSVLAESGVVRWSRLPEPNLVGAMNLGLRDAREPIVLFLDDDIQPSPGLLSSHLAAHHEHQEAAVVGQILQPGEEPSAVVYEPQGGRLHRYMDFPFYSTRARTIENVMAGNLSVKRAAAIAVGGFDENFTPPVASRFESEFARRLIDSGHRIVFDPRPSIRHLAVSTGGTRSEGYFLRSAKPIFAVGDYYFALRVGRDFERLRYMAKRPFRQVATRFHLRNPWWILPKFIGELRALFLALRLYRLGAKLAFPPAED
ncbi:MAG: glycosyltransferase [Pseudomonadota bacterium]